MKNILVILSCLFFTQCHVLSDCSDDSLSIALTEYTGTQLTNDGYYFKEIAEATDGDFTEVFFLFDDGIYTGGGGYAYNIAFESSINAEQIDTALTSKSAWGTFIITNNVIEIENWRSTRSGCFRTEYLKGEVVSETSFVITNRELREEGESVRSETVNNVFLFRPLDVLPSSDNEYIP